MTMDGNPEVVVAAKTPAVQPQVIKKTTKKAAAVDSFTCDFDDFFAERAAVPVAPKSDTVNKKE